MIHCLHTLCGREVKENLYVPVHIVISNLNFDNNVHQVRFVMKIIT